MMPRGTIISVAEPTGFPGAAAVAVALDNARVQCEKHARVNALTMPEQRDESLASNDAKRRGVSALTARAPISWTSTARRLVVFFVALLAVRTARAEEPTITARLDWQRAEGAAECIDGPALTRGVNRRWGRDVFVEGTADVTVHGTIRRTAPGYAATIELVESGGKSLGSRTLETREPSCKTLDDSVALAVGLMLDVSRARVAEERRSAAPEPLLGAPIEIPRPTEVSPQKVRFETWLAGNVALGLLPKASLGGSAGVAIVPPSFARLELDVSLFAPADANSSDGRGVTVSALLVGLGVCLEEWSARRAALEGCVVERVGRINGRGFGFSESMDASKLFVDVGAREALRLGLSDSIALRVAGTLGFPLVRYRFVFDDAASQRRTVSEASAVNGGAEVGLAFLW
jgi:hypothetical protein